MVNEKKPDTVYCCNYIICKSRKDQTIVKERSTAARDGAWGETMEGARSSERECLFGVMEMSFIMFWW